MEKIDIVLAWVDGGDVEWQKEKQKYSGLSGDKTVNRYRGWDTLRYWFRGIEKYASWVNKIHFVTWGHLPKWLNTEHEKINIVKHNDYIPEKYLPTFSANPIELNFHRIKGLQEKFVYFNDDMYVINQTNAEDFFVNGLPCDSAVLYPGTATNNNPGDMIFDNILLNDAHFFVRHYNIDEVIRKNRNKWYNIKYGKSIIKTMVMRLFPEFTGFMLNHYPASYLKKNLELAWELEPELLDTVSQNKFRHRDDINQYIFRYMQLGQGEFYPININKRGEYVNVGECQVNYDKVIVKSKYKILCLNDVAIKVDFELEKARMINAFETKFPVKSSFEL